MPVGSAEEIRREMRRNYGASGEAPFAARPAKVILLTVIAFGYRRE